MKQSFFKRIAVLTSGGDAPGMNAAIRAVTRRAVFRGAEVFGVHNGLVGLIADDFQPLGSRDVGRISHLGGTMSGTARCDEFRTDAGIKKARTNLSNRKVDGLVVIGGNGSQANTHAIAQLGLIVKVSPRRWKLALARLGDGDKAVRLLRMLNPVERAREDADRERYKVEPKRRSLHQPPRCHARPRANDPRMKSRVPDKVVRLHDDALPHEVRVVMGQQPPRENQFPKIASVYDFPQPVKP